MTTPLRHNHARYGLYRFHTYVYMYPLGQSSRVGSETVCYLLSDVTLGTYVGARGIAGKSIYWSTRSLVVITWLLSGTELARWERQSGESDWFTLSPGLPTGGNPST